MPRIYLDRTDEEKKEYHKIKSREYRLRNVDKCKQRKKDWSTKNKEKIDAYRKEHREEKRITDSKYRNSHKEEIKQYRIDNREWKRNYIKKYREKDITKTKDTCRWKTAYLVKKGIIIKNCCEICGDIKSETHHKDYTNPFDIIWLCPKHHTALHNFIKNQKQNEETNKVLQH